jgi:two-component system LytT family response regulator
MQAVYALPIKTNVIARVISHPAALQHHQKSATGKLALATSEGTRYVRYQNISYCRAESNYCMVVLTDGKQILISKTLKWVVDQVPESLFIRVHASYLVRKDEVSKQIRDFIVLESGFNIPVSRRKKGEVQKKLASR